MAIIIIGIILVILGFVAAKTDDPRIRHYKTLLTAIGAIVVILGVSSACVVQVEPGEVGVQKLFGKVNKNILESGLNVVNPFVKVVMFDTRTENYTMSGVNDEGVKQGDDAIRVLSADGLEVVIDLTVLYKVVPSEAPRILEQVGTNYRNVLVRPICRTRIRDNAVYYDAVALFSTKRDEFQSRIFTSIEADFKERGLMLEQLLIRNITLPESVRTTIESKINAEQEAQKMTFVLQKERQEAERKRVEAQGIADYQKILSTGLSDRLLQYEMIKAVSSSPNAKIILMTNGKGLPLMIDGK
ncbi:MAG TPA: prohibitin family protein [Bacteroidales bacterium]|nr:prohibitin family protein [Bacteroidales bacterium]